MNNEELKHKIHSMASSTLTEEIYISPVGLLMKIGVLSAKDYEDWRCGRVPYLEKVCKANLRKLSFIMKELRAYALENQLKPSWTAYNRWGVKGKKIPLRFSKSGDALIEKAYATHYVANTANNVR
ncbi:hypothetical protein DesLBE_1787 [Desulfitobacterium sp. LBE]|uniref:Uncharacterized protein n=4 Tax=Desulfitobacterium hafniense TaxID=49338 RepID=Q24QZ6_DESHY|nr:MULTISPECIES: hypothetical protein [Desulfitobacterium]ACL19640.1 conserved hypothetical protein [Desulfitobacterium hafniense DCB-2]EHL08253.1 hypothetical protein HMPREF0322_01011 [Desulfitobacterium hafniense DP7]KTE89669.1 hypothetical protein AT727_12635 [Desulfitobacterium hafniense]TWH57507.1 hypothetical protein DesLBE_1787 [Desulfitobacterium sp. LBE]CDX03924.1 Hypothetical protein DPCES_4038 [Desulfitobacterium hafniense]